MKLKVALILMSCLTLICWVGVAFGALVAHYPFEGNAVDLVNDNNGIVHGATLTTDRINHANSAYAFVDTSKNYIDAPNPSSLAISSAITIAAWVYIEEFRSTNFQVVQKNATGPIHAFAMPILGNAGIYYGGALQKNKFGLELTLNGTFTSGMWSATSLSAGNWYHLAATYDHSTQTTKLYLNGQLDKTITGVSGTIQQNDNFLNIGRFGGEDRDYFNGKLDDIRIYNEALSDSQIKNLYSSMLQPGTLMLLLD
jgi:hypothetical protein